MSSSHTLGFRCAMVLIKVTLICPASILKAFWTWGIAIMTRVCTGYWPSPILDLGLWASVKALSSSRWNLFLTWVAKKARLTTSIEKLFELWPEPELEPHLPSDDIEKKYPPGFKKKQTNCFSCWDTDTAVILSHLKCHNISLLEVGDDGVELDASKVNLSTLI